MIRIQLELSIDQLVEPDDSEALKRALFKLGYVLEPDAPINDVNLSVTKAIGLLRLLGRLTEDDHAEAKISIPEY